MVRQIFKDTINIVVIILLNIEYNCNPSKNYSLVLHFDIKNEWVIGFYLNRYPNYG